ncbi:hypothetical protein NL108_005388 [Boleophthalmus pectinirostris]|nr:hypothetical protein NL108_005388 [Boleophthalmus pectinirostris]
MEYHSGGSLPLLGRPRYCPGANANGGYLCETGHCCGESGCCTYYYELWWFWLLWTVLILFSCCCAYRHRRAKLRVQQQQRQRDISLLAYQGASSFPSSMLDLSFLASLKLPSYEEVAAQPSTPPPPYSSVFTAPRYPQPPRTADPHLLTQQHPGTLLHRPLQPLSDGPSSLSSDNSSSCSCDSCCPSSPCSSSLSAPVTYETDTSHTSTPSEATPLALDSVTMETISAAATRLELPQGKTDDSATVAILIEETNPAATTESVTVVATRSASPLETIASSNSDATFPVGITPPIKQQLDIKTVTTTPTSCPQSTENSKSNSPMTSPPASLNVTRTFDSTTSHKQPRTLNLILDSMGGNTDTNPSLVPISVSPQNPSRSILSDETCTSKSDSKIQKSDSKIQKSTPETTPSNLSPTRTLHLFADPVATNSDQSVISSPSSQGISNFSTKPAGETSELDTKTCIVTQQNDKVTYFVKAPSETAEIKSPAPTVEADVTKNHQDIFGSCKLTTELVQPTEMVAMNVDQKSENIDTSTLKNSGILQAPKSLLGLAPPLPESTDCTPNSKSKVTTQAVTPPISEMLNLTQKPSLIDVNSKIQSPTISQTQEIATTLPEPVSECISISIPDHANLVCPVLPLSQDVASKELSCQENIASSLRFYKEDPSFSSKAKSDLTLASDILWSTFDRKNANLSDEKTLSKSLPTESTSCLGVPQSHSLNLEHSFTNLPVKNENSNSFFPAITIQADPPSFATSPSSPCSIPSPSLPSPPVSMLLLDPLAALHASEKSAASSGHASSLSPSPRNTPVPA